MKETQTLFDTIKGNMGTFVALILLVVAAIAITVVAEKIASKKEKELNGRTEAMFSIRRVAIIGVFSAISFVLMLLEFPLPFAPSFYKFDFSDMPALIGGFAAGPMVAVMIEFIKVALNILLQGTTSGFVGEIANFVVGAAFVVPATIIYRFKKTRKTALISCVVGTLCIAVVGSLLNAFFLLPAYAIMFGSGIDVFVQMGAAINPAISNVFTFCLFAVAPFNLVKGLADSAITFLVYKQLSPILKADQMVASKKVAKA
ncbi:ECF transporter S component [Butyrivibrio sp. VCB2006]|uniref:ECF transporter S component n=1 Tax=Butyrivibrio sp. VCB2006 TaxID=1280679 RepID=UPI00040EF91A|nr:ECF transporter S component [Butyrivibrio sp. VCB2006]